MPRDENASFALKGFCAGSSPSRTEDRESPRAEASFPGETFARVREEMRCARIEDTGILSKSNELERVEGLCRKVIRVREPLV
jgi:hypothetical protein